MPWNATGSSLKGPKGDTGAQGPQGAQGPAGADGGTTAHAARHLPGGGDPISNGIPAGGAAGTVLRKNSATDYDDAWSPESGRLLGRNVKPSGTIAVTTAEKVVLVASAPVVAGRSYRLTGRTENDSGASGGVSNTMLRTTLGAGSTVPADPTTAAALVTRALFAHSVASVPDTCEVEGIYDCTTTGILKVALTVARAVGSAQITVRADGTPIRLWIRDDGPTVADAGTVGT